MALSLYSQSSFNSFGCSVCLLFFLYCLSYACKTTSRFFVVVLSFPGAQIQWASSCGNPNHFIILPYFFYHLIYYMLPAHLIAYNTTELILRMLDYVQNKTVQIITLFSNNLVICFGLLIFLWSFSCNYNKPQNIFITIKTIALKNFDAILIKQIFFSQFLPIFFKFDRKKCNYSNANLQSNFVDFPIFRIFLTNLIISGQYT